MARLLLEDYFGSYLEDGLERGEIGIKETI